MDGAQGRNRTTDTAIFSRMLYQLSYLGAGRLPIAHATQPIKLRSAAGSSSASLGVAGYPILLGQPAAQVDIRAAAAAERPKLVQPRACRRSDTMSPIVCAQSSFVSSVHAVAGSVGSDRRIKARPARRARSGRASASLCSAATIAGDARSTGIRCGAAATSAAIRRSAASPAACGPASSSCSGGCTRAPHDLRQPQCGEAEQARPQRVLRQRGVQGRAQARPADAPAARRNPPGSRRTDCAAGSAAPAPAATRRVRRPMGRRLASPRLPPRRRASTSIATSAGVGWMCSRDTAGKLDIRLRQRLHLLLDVVIERPGHDNHAIAQRRLQPGGQGASSTSTGASG